MVILIPVHMKCTGAVVIKLFHLLVLINRHSSLEKVDKTAEVRHWHYPLLCTVSILYMHTRIIFLVDGKQPQYIPSPGGVCLFEADGKWKTPGYRVGRLSSQRESICFGHGSQ